MRQHHWHAVVLQQPLCLFESLSHCWQLKMLQSEGQLLLWSHQAFGTSLHNQYVHWLCPWSAQLWPQSLSMARYWSDAQMGPQRLPGILRHSRISLLGSTRILVRNHCVTPTALFAMAGLLSPMAFMTLWTAAVVPAPVKMTTSSGPAFTHCLIISLQLQMDQYYDTINENNTAFREWGWGHLGMWLRRRLNFGNNVP